MTPIRMLVAALAVLSIAVPCATAATPPEAHARALSQMTWRSPGHPSEHAGGVVPADPVPVTRGAGSSVDWPPILFSAGVALVLVLGAGMLATRRHPPSAVA